MVYWRYFRERGTQSRRNSCVARSRFFFFKQKTAYEIGHVTGVQTCALPIYLGKPYLDGYRAIFIKDPSAQVAAVRGERAMIQFRGFTPSERDQLVTALGNKITVQESPWNRSEERRVGKECRGRWWAEHECKR